MIGKLLIANRGEIARRIIRTARRLGVATVAVHSDADAALPFVREADAAVRLGGAAASESYLAVDRIIAAAKTSGAEAIHPGYGFLSENAEFAEAVVAAGLVWVGAPPDAIRAMGLKDRAKRLMEEAGVPVTPGYLGADQRPDRLAVEAKTIGYPVLIKAVAGGGGKGMRRVDAPADFAEALASCRREAAAAFGDEHMLLERYVRDPRHIEVQVFGDTHGNVVHLFERDCSLQRRHQKVIEEAPAPGMDAATREKICAIAVKAARAVDYVGAGTIELIAEPVDGRLVADRIWFMEMNTRLQVEHPVTEAITGQDLVEWQLRVASGETLPRRQEELAINGWAMEARLYAENPASGFLPSTGRLERLRLPNDVRVDAGVAEGDEITAHYDPMIAKLVARGSSREAAARRLAEAAAAVEVWPVRTNAGFLARAARDADFLAARIDTGFIERHAARLVPPPEPPEEALRAAASALVPRDSSDARDPWTALAGFRTNAPPDRRIAVEVAGAPHLVTLDDASTRARPAAVGATKVVFLDGDAWAFGAPKAGHAAGEAASDGMILAPMPGRIIEVLVADGQAVTRGQRLVVLEAMKMEHALVAPLNGTCAEVKATQGAQVSEGAVLLRVVKEGD